MWWLTISPCAAYEYTSRLNSGAITSIGSDHSAKTHIIFLKGTPGQRE